MTRKIMTYAQLLKIVEQFDLYPEMVANGEVSGAVKELRESIALESISFNKGSQSAAMAFSLSYEGYEPKKVMKVTEALSQLYLHKDLIAREKVVSGTANFFQQELETLKEQVRFQEDRMREFKSKHLGELPENQAFNLQNVSRLEMELERITSRVRGLEDRKIYLKGQLASVEPLRPVTTDQGQVASNPKERLKRLRLELMQMQARLSEKHPDIRKVKSEIAKLQSQVGQSDVAVDKIKLLNEKRAKLAELKGRLSNKHPDVIKLTKQVKLLSSQVDKLLTDKSIVQISEERPDNPAYINLLTQVVSAEAEIKALKQKEGKVLSNLSDFRAKLSQAPLIEQEYNEISMDLSNAKEKYKEILNNLAKAQVAQQMERQQKGEKFMILEPAYLPGAPSKPNRILISLLGLILGIGAAVAVAAFQEGVDQSLKNEVQLAKISGLPVLSSVTLVLTEEERTRKRKRYSLCAVGAVGLLLIVLVFANMVTSN